LIRSQGIRPIAMSSSPMNTNDSVGVIPRVPIRGLSPSIQNDPCRKAFQPPTTTKIPNGTKMSLIHQTEPF
jgi:hypothetical protein